MASAQEVAAYRATHSVAETMAHFGIKERAVFKACAKVRELQEANAPTTMTTTHTARRVVRRCASRPKYQRHRTPVTQKVVTPKKVNELDEVAGDDTTWACPYTNEEYPIIPGTTKRMWLAERRTAFVLRAQRSTPSPPKATYVECSTPSPENAPQTGETTSQSAPVLSEKSAPLHPAPVHLHQQAPQVVYVKQYVRVRRDFKRGLVYQTGELLAQHGPPWTVWVALFVFLLIVWFCQV